MTMFGIKSSHLSDVSVYHVSEDDVLWEWLQADSVEGSGGHESRVIDAPVGYVFNSAGAVVERLASYGDVDEFPTIYPAFSRRHYVRNGMTRSSSKVRMLLSEYSNVLTVFSEEEFGDLQIEESRILHFHI